MERVSVLKFGGKSLDSLEKVKSVCEYVSLRAKKEKVIMVVSAMGDSTNLLIQKAEEFGETCSSSRELDMLLSTAEMQSAALCAIMLNSLGANAVSLSAFQAGIYAKGMHGKAVITGIKKSAITDYLENFDIVVITGFQAVNNKEIFTIGRGGSDTTAVALGIVFNSEVEIFSDFDGIFMGDPRHYDYKKIKNIGYDETICMAESGAKVLCASAIEMAKKSKTKIICKQSNKPDMDGSYVFSMPNNNITINIVENIAKMTILFSNNEEKLQKTLNYIQNNVNFIEFSVNFSKITLLLYQNDVKKVEKQIAELNNLIEEQ